MNTVDVQWRLLKQEEIQQSPSRNYRPPQHSANSTTAAAGSLTPSAVSPLHSPFASQSPVVLSSSPLASDDERRLRCHWSSFLQLCGLMLELPNVTVCTALVYFHRFYATCPFQEYDPAVPMQAAQSSVDAAERECIAGVNADMRLFFCFLLLSAVRAGLSSARF
jgi:hypothetical protein